MADINLSVPVLPGDDLPERDALHVPVVLVTAKTTIMPGCRIVITREGNTLFGHFISAQTHDPLAPIANPFLKGAINAGTKFYALLPPGSDVKLVHSWTSPKIPDPIVPEQKVNPRIDHFEEVMSHSLDEIVEAIRYVDNLNADGCRGCY